MKASELRIGNFVYNGFKEVLKGKSICTSSYAGYNIETCKPIPLTEEWLFKFGFKKWKNKKIWTFTGVMIYQMKDGKFYRGRKSCRICIDTVHQLQNLYFALTGEELVLTKD